MQLEQVLGSRRTSILQTDSWFDRVFEETKEQVLRYILVHLDEPCCADDVFQEVYTKLYQRIVRRGTADIREPAAFVMKMAKREVIRHGRMNRKHKTVSVDEMLPVTAGSGPAFEDSVADREVIRTIQETVRAMPPLTYKVFVLYYYFDMAVASIADELGTTVDAVKSRLSRARREVRANLKWED